MTTIDHLQRRLSERVRAQGHLVQTVVPHGWEPHDLMKQVLADIEFESRCITTTENGRTTTTLPEGTWRQLPLKVV